MSADKKPKNPSLGLVMMTMTIIIMVMITTKIIIKVMIARPIIIMVMVMMVGVDDIVNRQKAKEAKSGMDYEINNDNT